MCETLILGARVLVGHPCIKEKGLETLRNQRKGAGKTLLHWVQFTRTKVFIVGLVEVTSSGSCRSYDHLKMVLHTQKTNYTRE